jgi:SAM-dependent methyltransferase
LLLSEITKEEPETPKVKVNLACGQRKDEGWIGVDIVKTDVVDIVHDLTKMPWPFADASVDEIFCHHFMEHINGAQRMEFMNECWRIMKPGATLQIICPHWSSMRAVQDPTHVYPPLCETSFLYFNKKWRELNKLDHYPITCDFEYGYAYMYDPELNGKNADYQAMAQKHWLNAIWDIAINLTKNPPK